MSAIDEGKSLAEKFRDRKEWWGKYTSEKNICEKTIQQYIYE